MAGWSLRGQRPGFVPETRDLGCDVLLGVGEVCRPTSQRCEEAAPAGRRKPAPNTDRGGASARYPEMRSDRTVSIGDMSPMEVIHRHQNQS